MTYTQDFSPYQHQATARHAGDANPEGKAAARRRRQMERTGLRLVPTIHKVDEALAIEQAQADVMARVIEWVLEPSTAPLTESTDCKRVTQAKLTEWFQRWHKPIRNWLGKYAKVPSGDIDDLAQEVFVRLLKYSDQVLVENPKGYLFRIAFNVASEWRDRSCIRNPHEAGWLEDLVADNEERPDQLVERWTENRRVRDAIDRLKPRQRLLLKLHAQDGMTYNQIAEDQGLTYRMVLRDLTRAYSTLRSKLR